MPYFTYYDEYQRESVLTYLNQQYNIFSASGPLYEINAQEQLQGDEFWKSTCSQCHGDNGEVSKLGMEFKPPPPDFTQYSLTPQRTLDIIANGYPGTMMSSYSQIKEPMKQALVNIILEKRKTKD